jgi:hypothetical protein
MVAIGALGLRQNLSNEECCIRKDEQMKTISAMDGDRIAKKMAADRPKFIAA